MRLIARLCFFIVLSLFGAQFLESGCSIYRRTGDLTSLDQMVRIFNLTSDIKDEVTTTKTDKGGYIAEVTFERGK